MIVHGGSREEGSAVLTWGEHGLRLPWHRWCLFISFDRLVWRMEAVDFFLVRIDIRMGL